MYRLLTYLITDILSGWYSNFFIAGVCDKITVPPSLPIATSVWEAAREGAGSRKAPFYHSLILRPMADVIRRVSLSFPSVA